MLRLSKRFHKLTLEFPDLGILVSILCLLFLAFSLHVKNISQLYDLISSKSVFSSCPLIYKFHFAIKWIKEKSSKLNEHIQEKGVHTSDKNEGRHHTLTVYCPQ